jgi:crotonobetainyl-CoA:carnitine CoA-transferase CaiB-like acyl-CoA transferase
VIDITSSLAGPTCTQVVAALGADVVKVEPPSGDHARVWGPPFVDGVGSLFLSANAGKRSISLDLKLDQERRVLDELLSRADAVVVAMRPGAAERLGLDAETLRTTQPQLIHCTVGAFGREGPLASDAGYDPMLQAFSGILSVTGESDRPGVRAGVSLVDFSTGLWTALSMVSALLEREKTGQGATIEVSLFETAMWLLGPQVTSLGISGEPPGRHGTGFPLIAPYEVFQTLDGELMIAAANDKLFEQLARCLELPTDPRYATNASRVANRESLAESINAKLQLETTGTWMTRLRDAGVPVAPVNDLSEAVAHEQTRAMGVLQELDGIQIVAPPVTVNGERMTYTGSAPALGAHLDEVLGEWLDGDDALPATEPPLERHASIPGSTTRTDGDG